jgi:ABC-type antimicrobial peptide transport system permease subunit
VKIRGMPTAGSAFHGLWQDVRYSVRMLRRSPGFSLMAVAILSLDVRSLTQVADEILFPGRAAVGVLFACGVAGLLLACVGIYGVISHSVAQRLQEIGIRATLGADRRDILTLVLREAIVMSIAGALPALGLALLALKLTANAVGAVPVFDPVAFGTVGAIGLGIILAASYLPARRASRLDPMTVLRGL